MKKLYLVKREVWAENIESAVRSKGTVYEITQAEEKYQTAEETKNIGFKKLSSNKKT